MIEPKNIQGKSFAPIGCAATIRMNVRDDLGEC